MAKKSINIPKKSNPVAAKAKSTSSKHKSTGGGGNKKGTEAVKEKILEELGKMLRMGKKSVKTILIAKACGYASTDSKGFRIPKKELQDEGKIVSKTDTLSLSLEMMEQIKNDMPAVPEAKTNKERQEQVKELFKNEKCIKNIVKMIDALSDGRSMIPKDLAVLMGYANVDSKGYRIAKNILMESDYVEMKDKKIRLTDFMFPEGRS
jgi:hypothetical protein